MIKPVKSMDLKKLLLLILIPLLSGCGTAISIKQTVNGNAWYPVNMRPSQISLNGYTFFTKEINDNEFIEVYFDDELLVDAAYYYNQLLASYGWTPVGGGKIVASQYSTLPSQSTLHISIKRGVAIYLYPDEGYDVFGIREVKSIH